MRPAHSLLVCLLSGTVTLATGAAVPFISLDTRTVTYRPADTFPAQQARPGTAASALAGRRLAKTAAGMAKAGSDGLDELLEMLIDDGMPNTSRFAAGVLSIKIVADEIALSLSRSERTHGAKVAAGLAQAGSDGLGDVLELLDGEAVDREPVGEGILRAKAALDRIVLSLSPVSGEERPSWAVQKRSPYQADG